MEELKAFRGKVFSIGKKSKAIIIPAYMHRFMDIGVGDEIIVSKSIVERKVLKTKPKSKDTNPAILEAFNFKENNTNFSLAL